MLPSHALSRGEPSRTARSAAMHRAAHQLLDRPLVFDDPFALGILGHSGIKRLRAEADLRTRLASRSMRAFIVARSRTAEDCLARAHAEGVRQYVVLGAGLDTFALRNPFGEDLAIFEADHPATQAWKIASLRAQRLTAPPNLTWVAVDFERESLGERLAAAGFRSDLPAVVAWLGVTMYLTREAVFETLRTLIRVCAKGSLVVFDYAVPAATLSPAESAARKMRESRVARIGEPWITDFDPEALRAEIVALGAQDAETLDAEALNALYFADRTDGLRVAGASGRIMTVRV